MDQSLEKLQLENHRENANGKKIVYISLGTIFNQDFSFYQICINTILQKLSNDFVLLIAIINANVLK